MSIGGLSESIESKVLSLLHLEPRLRIELRKKKKPSSIIPRAQVSLSERVIVMGI